MKLQTGYGILERERKLLTDNTHIFDLFLFRSETERICPTVGQRLIVPESIDWTRSQRAQ